MAALGIREGGVLGEPFRGSQLESHLLLVPAVEKGPQQRESVIMEVGSVWQPKAGASSLGLGREVIGQDYAFQL